MPSVSARSEITGTRSRATRAGNFPGRSSAPKSILTKSPYVSANDRPPRCTERGTLVAGEEVHRRAAYTAVCGFPEVEGSPMGRSFSFCSLGIPTARLLRFRVSVSWRSAAACAPPPSNSRARARSLPSLTCHRTAWNCANKGAPSFRVAVAIPFRQPISGALPRG